MTRQECDICGRPIGEGQTHKIHYVNIQIEEADTFHPNEPLKPAMREKELCGICADKIKKFIDKGLEV